jgi:hypothetical protein
MGALVIKRLVIVMMAIDRGFLENCQEENKVVEFPEGICYESDIIIP